MRFPENTRFPSTYKHDFTLNSAVLFLIFNRPEPTSRVFDAIRRARPQRLYVAADGPRESRSEEREKCDETRRIVSRIDWPCDLKTFYRTVNAGCRINVRHAIEWFFDHEEEGIILEDDCLPDPSFFPFCDELLERYRHDAEIMMISGDNFCPRSMDLGDSYFFSRYSHIWGWATWRRAWRFYDAELREWPMLRKTSWLKTKVNGYLDAEYYWRKKFDADHACEIDSWDYALQYSHLRANGLSVLPSRALVTNIGFGVDATHTKELDPVFLPTVHPMEFPLRHPNCIECSVRYDRWIDRKFFRTHIWWMKSLSDRIPGLNSFLKGLKEMIHSRHFT